MIVVEEITLSVGDHGAVGISNLQVLLKKFEQQFEIHVHLEISTSSLLRWSRLVESALYQTGPDISEVGTTWVGDLVRMEALRLFQPEEVDAITQGVRYFDAVQPSSVRTDNGVPTIYSIPLAADVRVVFFRRDLLEKAGVDEATAFAGFAQLEKTLTILKEKGVSEPLALPFLRSPMTLHCIASWIWGAGGDFLTPDGTNLAFDQAQALEGCKAYYRLIRFFGPDMRILRENEAYDLFGMGKAAVYLSGFWEPTFDLAAEVRKNLGAAPMPGTPFVGGGDLVIWSYSRHELSALKLIRFLHTDEAAELLYPWFGLPIREDGWSRPPFDTKIYQVFKAAILKGRAFSTARLWGLVEKRLTVTLADIWAEVLREPESNSDIIVETHIKGLAERLKLTLDL